MADIDGLPSQVNILTLNCWGIPYICPERPNRLAEIGRHITKAYPMPHIVGLQECFSRHDFKRIHQETRSVLPYAKLYYSAPFGAGLAILSRWPIVETSFFRYPLNGSPTAFTHGDWYVGKGVAYARIQYGKASDNVIDVFNTHIHASYPGSNEYLCHRIAQAWELGKLLRFALQCRRGRALVVALGDLNSEPTSLPCRIVKHLVPEMHDTWLQFSLQRELSSRSGERRITTQKTDSSIQDGATYGSSYNTWMWTRGQRARYLEQRDTRPDQLISPSDFDHSQSIRIDYVLANVAVPRDHTPQDNNDSAVNPSADKLRSWNKIENTVGFTQDDGLWTVKAAKVGMIDRHPVLGYSLSDHLSVEVTLVFEQRQQRNLQTLPLELSDPSCSGSSISTGDKSTFHGASGLYKTLRASVDVTSKLEESNGVVDPDGLLEEILHILRDYKLMRQKRAWWRKARLGVAGIVLMGSLAGVWVIGKFGGTRFLLAIAGALAASFAVSDVCRNLLFEFSEAAALRELEWEVRNANAGHYNDRVSVDQVNSIRP
ncbi:DNase I-like protein [Camillea tinctor]|nr:DNase I-like protein [Camillea tinctor]